MSEVNKTPRQAWQVGLVSYALESYSRDNVKNICLQLQNEYHANVNIILWCGWLRTESITLNPAHLNDVLISIDSLSQMTVGRLRDVRCLIKESACFTRVQSQLINKHILNAEITAEKIFLQRLQDLTARFLEADTCNSFEGIGLNLEYYLEFLNVSDAQDMARLMEVLVNEGELEREV